MRIRLLQLSMVMFGLMFLLPAFGLPKGALPKGISIGSVNIATNTVTLVLRRPGEGIRQVLTYKIELGGASITVNGTPATLAQVHRGQRVLGYSEGDEHVLVSLDVEN
jgi:hypothetical protein